MRSGAVVRPPAHWRWYTCFGARVVDSNPHYAYHVRRKASTSPCVSRGQGTSMSPMRRPVGITGGPDDALWFTAGDYVARISMQGEVTGFPAPREGGRNDITTGPDQNLWYADSGTSTGIVGRVTPAGQFTEFFIPPQMSLVDSITAGPDGDLWFTEDASGSIGRITPTGSVTLYRIPGPLNSPTDITIGPDSNVWFIEEFGVRVGRISPVAPNPGATFGFFSLNNQAGPSAITSGPDGNIWLTDRDRSMICRMALDGTVTEFVVGGGVCCLTTLRRGLITTCGSPSRVWGRLVELVPQASLR